MIMMDIIYKYHGHRSISAFQIAEIRAAAFEVKQSKLRNKS